jgi:phosphatidylserine decarboxylase
MIRSLLIDNLVWAQGWQILCVLGVASLVSYKWFPRLLIVVCAFLLFTIYFFRNPERVCPEAQQDSSVIICPADGKIVDIQYDPKGGFDGFARKVSIFLSPLDVHVQWTPIAGVVKQVQYKQGTFAMAFLPKSSELNERNDIRLMSADGKELLVRQIAGTIARRICCWVEQGQEVPAGHKFGMIKFGSRVDILLPESAEVAVAMDQRVYGGQTVLGRW